MYIYETNVFTKCKYMYTMRQECTTCIARISRTTHNPYLWTKARPMT